MSRYVLNTIYHFVVDVRMKCSYREPYIRLSTHCYMREKPNPFSQCKTLQKSNINPYSYDKICSYGHQLFSNVKQDSRLLNRETH